MHEYGTAAFLFLTGVGMVVLRDTVALLQASVFGLIMGMSNARKLIPILKIEVVIGGSIFAGMGIYSVIKLL